MSYFDWRIESLRKGLLGPFQLGQLSGLTDAIRIAEDVTGNKGCDLEGLFFATAFQTGIDKFITHETKDNNKFRSSFVQNRTQILKSANSDSNWKEVREGLSKYLPEEWYRDDRYSGLWEWNAFIADLLDAMDHGASLLSLGGVPEISDVVDLIPTELQVPLKILHSAFEPASAPSTVPITVVAKESIERFQDIITSDVFSDYIDAEGKLDDASSSLPAALNGVLKSAKQVVKKNPHLLTVRRTGVSVLSFTPKLIDAAFGKLPGAIADVAAKLGLTYIEERRRIVVYDFRDIIRGALWSNLVRMIKAANEKEPEQSAQLAIDRLTIG